MEASGPRFSLDIIGWPHSGDNLKESFVQVVDQRFNLLKKVLCNGVNLWFFKILCNLLMLLVYGCDS